MATSSSDGFVLTWRYTQASLWLYVAALQARCGRQHAAATAAWENGWI